MTCADAGSAADARSQAPKTIRRVMGREAGTGVSAEAAQLCSAAAIGTMSRRGIVLRCAAYWRAGMPRFVIEREIPRAGRLGDAEVLAISQKSCAVLRDLPRVQWQHSYVTDDKIYCVYIAPDAESVREHARRGGFPANAVNTVRRIIDPTTAEAAAV